jgi:hypothetical protein
MTPRVKVVRISVRKHVGELLMLRSTVGPLFEQVSKQEADLIVFDFSAVEFMSRSFADEYLAAKSASSLHIEESHMAVEVRRMLKLVSDQVRAAASRTPRLDRAAPRPRAVAL